MIAWSFPDGGRSPTCATGALRMYIIEDNNVRVKTVLSSQRRAGLLEQMRLLGREPQSHPFSGLDAQVAFTLPDQPPGRRMDIKACRMAEVLLTGSGGFELGRWVLARSERQMFRPNAHL